MVPLRSVRVVVRSAACLGILLVMALLARPASVSAATTLLLNPDTATPGTRVTIYNACLGVTDSPPPKLPAAFVGMSVPDQLPTDANVSRGVATAKAKAGSGVYSVVVPELAPGKYDVKLECKPGDWSTNNAEGIGMFLTVRAGSPDTSAAPDPVAPGPSEDQLRTLIVAAAGMIGATVALRRRRAPVAARG